LCCITTLIIISSSSSYCSLAPRALHSFPTRRSSDLGAPPGADLGRGAGRRRRLVRPVHHRAVPARQGDRLDRRGRLAAADGDRLDRKSTRLNSSHLGISYAVFCLKKKKNTKHKENNK